MPEQRPGRRRSFVDRDPLTSRPAIDFVRDPSLLPSGRERHIQDLWDAIERYRVRLHALSVLKDVDARRQMELAALVLDLDARNRDWTNHRAYYDDLKWRSKRPGHVRKLARKMKQIRSDLEALIRVAKNGDKRSADDVVPHAVAALVALSRSPLVPPGETVEQFTARLPTFFERSRGQRLQSDDPRAPTAMQLFELFQDAGVAKLQAYVRTAKVGNALWGWKYEISKNDFDVEECPAVRVLITRHRQSSTTPSRRIARAARRRTSRQGTDRKKNR